MSWQKIISEEAFRRQKRALFKEGSHQIVILSLSDEIYAVDNRCPHQGYPLYEGSLDSDEVLTCHWHNWKFDLKTGKCVSGGDSVKTYPTKKENGFVWVDISAPSSEEITEKILEGLKIAFDDRKYGRLSREIARLYYQGIDPTIALQKAIEWSHAKLKKGMGNAYRAAADWLTIYSEQKGNFENQLICLTEAVDHIAYEVLGKKEIPRADALGMTEEAMDDEHACVKAALAHYYEGGKGLVGLQKVSRLVDGLGEGVYRPLLSSWARSLSHLTQEDSNPTFCHSNRHSEGVPSCHSEGASCHSEGVSPRNLFEDLLQKCSKNILYFNLDYQFSFDKPVSQNVDLLDVSEPLVFARAVYEMCQKYPTFWEKGVKQLAYFCQRHDVFQDKNLDVSEWAVSDEGRFWKESLEKLLDHGISHPPSVGSLLAAFMAVKGLKSAVPDVIRSDLLSALNRLLNTPLKEKHTRRKARQNIALVKL